MILVGIMEAVQFFQTTLHGTENVGMLVTHTCMSFVTGFYVPPLRTRGRGGGRN